MSRGPWKKTRERNERLHKVLSTLRDSPTPASQEAWAHSIIDIVRAVFRTQFPIMQDTPDGEDLQQAAVVEFLRITPRLTDLTTRLDPDDLFRVSYSVARFSMLREYQRLQKHTQTKRRKKVKKARRPMRVDQIPAEYEPEHPRVESCAQDLEDESREAFSKYVLPHAILRQVDGQNRYANTDREGLVRFVAVQRLRGRYVSANFVRAMWQCRDASSLVAYGSFLARSAILAVSISADYRRQAAP